MRAGFAAVEAAEGASQLRRRRYAAEDFPPPVLREKKELDASERGSAVHLALQYADLERCVTPEGAAEALEELGRKRLLTKEQCAAVDPAKLRAFCMSGVMAEARRGTIHREFKFSLLAPVREFLGEGEGETLLQGVVDLWSELPEGILLVDYKTDRVTLETEEARAREYEPQLRAYAWALERITGKKVLRRMIWFFATGRAVEV
jgi:ATP-dependent helicase/nuclease subunit A